jgi:hypothetical protein
MGICATDFCAFEEEADAGEVVEGADFLFAECLGGGMLTAFEV